MGFLSVYQYRCFYQVAPAELEDLLLRHDAVADAGVIGIPHEEEELARAYVVRQPGSDVTADELVKYVAGRFFYDFLYSITPNKHSHGENNGTNCIFNKMLLAWTLYINIPMCVCLWNQLIEANLQCDRLCKW